MKKFPKSHFPYYLYLLSYLLSAVIISFSGPTIPWSGRVAQVLMPMALYVFLLSIWKRPSKVYLWLFPMTFLMAFSIVLIALSGYAPVSVDMWLNLVTTNAAEAGNVLKMLFPALVTISVLFIPAIIYAIVDLAKKRCEPLTAKFRKKGRWTALGLLIVSLPFLIHAESTGNYMFTADNVPFCNVYNLGLAGRQFYRSAMYEKRSADFTFDAKCTDVDTAQVVVLVIGETSRAENWQLAGYNRETNPELSQVEGLAFYKNCLSQSNTTHKSVPILLTTATAENYDALYAQKGLMAAYREAGYHTVFLSNQSHNGSFIDFLASQADETVFMRDSLGGEPYDEVLLPLMREQLSKHHGQKLLLVLHTFGSHTDYSNRYPSEFCHFKPVATEEAKPSERPKLINAYDNSIRYTDHVLAQIIGDLKADNRPAAMLYVSDHGEDIFDDERQWYLHASYVPSYYQLHVPLLTWTNAAYAASHPDRVKLLEAHENMAVQSDCVFPTLLQLGGIKTKYSDKTLDLASPEFREKKNRKYLNDRCQPVDLERCLLEIDRPLIRD